MARKQRRQRGDSTIASSITTRRNEFLAAVTAQQKETQRLAKAAQSSKNAVAKSVAKLDQQSKAVKATEKQLARLRREFETAEENSKNAEAALSAAQGALDEFDRRLQELVGTAPPKSPRRKKAAARTKRGTGKAASRTTRGKGPHKITQAKALADALPSDRGIPVQEILQRVKERFGMEIKKSSAGTTLSLLKRDGKVSHSADGWRAAEAAPDTGQAEVAEAPAQAQAPAEGENEPPTT